MITNLMEPSHPFLLPRTVPTSAGVMFHKPQVSIIKDLETEPFTTFVIRPDVENTLTYSALSASDLILPSEYQIPEIPRQFTQTDSTTLYATLEMDDGNFLVPQIFKEHLGGQILYPDGSQQPDYQAFYPKLEWPIGGHVDVWFQVDELQAPGFDIGVSVRDLQDNVLSTGSVVSLVRGLLHFQANLSTASTGPTDIKIVISCDGQPQTVGFFTLSLQNFSIANNHVVKKTLSLWDLLGNVEGAATSKQQFYAAERYSITGFSALIQNTTAAQYKSGSIVCAQLPGGSEHLVPTDLEEAYRFIASYNDPKTYSGQLNKGMHWFFSPEKVQDWFFRPTEDHGGERPYLAVATSGVAVNDLANKVGLTVHIRINIELLTTDISLMKFMPSPDLSRLFDIYITLVNAHNSLGENPDHKRKIRKIVSSILSSPYTKMALQAAVKAGKVVVPLALAAM